MTKIDVPFPKSCGDCYLCIRVRGFDEHYETPVCPVSETDISDCIDKGTKLKNCLLTE